MYGEESEQVGKAGFKALEPEEAEGGGGGADGVEESDLGPVGLHIPEGDGAEVFDGEEERVPLEEGPEEGDFPDLLG